MNGMVLVRKGVQRVEASGLRDGSTGRVLSLLPKVWAVAEVSHPAHDDKAVMNGAPRLRPRPKPEMAFYRKYTEGMLRRYLRLSMEVGRVPSLLGRELFRGRVTSYRVRSFEDVVIFCMDVETCLGRLQPMERQLLKRIAVQEYSQAEAASALGLTLRSCSRMYGEAVDRLTGMFLEAGMLEPLGGCQEG